MLSAKNEVFMAIRAPMNFNGFVEGRHSMSFRSLIANETPLLKEADLCEFLVQMDQREYEVLTQENLQLKAEQEKINHNYQSGNRLFGIFTNIIAGSSLGIGIICLLVKIYYLFKKENIYQDIKNREKLAAEFDRQHNFDPWKYKSGFYDEREQYKSLVKERAEKFGVHPDYRDPTWNKVVEYRDKAGYWSDLSLVPFFFAALMKIGHLGLYINGQFTPKASEYKVDKEICRNRQMRILSKIRILEGRIRVIDNAQEIEQLNRAKDYFQTFWSQAKENASLVIHTEL